mmetsp:Transcript_11672/g.17823  ORF Transcript_11672/g.17823 Transcript_11672/m.17823 type:complete len:216 (+) Transcript_11672:440-1087(+)
MGCDGLVALNKIFILMVDTSLKSPHSDLVHESQVAVQETPITWRFHHIPGHQDESGIFPLDRWASLNVQADLQAKIFRQQLSLSYDPKSLSLPNKQLSIWLQENKLIKNKKHLLLQWIHGPETTQWWVQQKRITETTKTLVDWKALSQAFKLSKLSRRIGIQKHTSGFCSVGKMVVRWNLRTNDSCPRCGAPEDTAHIWRCPHPAAMPNLEPALI